jgi:hypothetical protein
MPIGWLETGRFRATVSPSLRRATPAAVSGRQAYWPVRECSPIDTPPIHSAMSTRPNWMKPTITDAPGMAMEPT